MGSVQGGISVAREEDFRISQPVICWSYSIPASPKSTPYKDSRLSRIVLNINNVVLLLLYGNEPKAMSPKNAHYVLHLLEIEIKCACLLCFERIFVHDLLRDTCCYDAD